MTSNNGMMGIFMEFFDVQNSPSNSHSNSNNETNNDNVLDTSGKMMIDELTNNNANETNTSWSSTKKRQKPATPRFSTSLTSTTTTSGAKNLRSTTFFLSTPESRRRPKYLLAAALGLPMVHYKWLSSLLSSVEKIDPFNNNEYKSWR